MSYYVTMFVLGLFVGLVARVAYAEGERLLQVARYKRFYEEQTGEDIDSHTARAHINGKAVERKLEGYEEEYEWLN